MKRRGLKSGDSMVRCGVVWCGSERDSGQRVPCLKGGTLQWIGGNARLEREALRISNHDYKVVMQDEICREGCIDLIATSVFGYRLSPHRISTQVLGVLVVFNMGRHHSW